MYRSVNGFMGAAAIEVIKQYSFDRAFIGSCGVDMTDCAVTTSGVEDGLTKKAAVQSSRHKYVVMERESFILTNLINIHILMISAGSLPMNFRMIPL